MNSRLFALAARLAGGAFSNPAFATLALIPLILSVGFATDHGGARGGARIEAPYQGASGLRSTI